MVDFGQATYIDGTINPGAILRRNTQRDTGSGSGVIRPGDLKITQMDVPGAGVKVAAGDALVQSRAPGAERETYGVPLSSSQNYLGDGGAGIPGTGSSVPSGGRRDMVFLEILDPGLPTFYTPEVDWPSGQSVKVSIIQNVPATARSIADVPALANITGYALALITYPASTSTITNAMILDLRTVQSPLSIRQPDLVTFGGTVALPGTTEVVWPAASQQVRIHERANELTVMARILGMLVTVNSVGVEFRLRLGNTGSFIYSDTTGLTTDTASGGTERVDKVVPMRVQIPAAMRGTTQPLVIMAKKTTGTGTLSVTNRTVVEFDTTLAETTV